MFSQRSSIEPMKTIYFRLLPEVLRARKFFAGLHPGNFTSRGPQAAKRISALPHPRAARALPRDKILLQLSQIGRTEPACH
jgi:hypothetical protein